MKFEPKHTPGPWRLFAGSCAHSDTEYSLETQEFYTLAYIVDEPYDAKLIQAAPELLEALSRLMQNDCPLMGDPSYEQLIEHWEYEKTQGRGEADDQLFALRTLHKALGL